MIAVQRVLVNSISCEVGMCGRSGPSAIPRPNSTCSPALRLRSNIGGLATGRMTTPEEVATLVVILASKRGLPARPFAVVGEQIIQTRHASMVALRRDVSAAAELKRLLFQRELTSSCRHRFVGPAGERA
jgi:hypothetical protein